MYTTDFLFSVNYIRTKLEQTFLAAGAVANPKKGGEPKERIGDNRERNFPLERVIWGIIYLGGMIL